MKGIYILHQLFIIEKKGVFKPIKNQIIRKQNSEIRAIYPSYFQ